MRTSILTIGDELLIGQVLNSNVHWMSGQLTDIGASVTRHLTVGDAFHEINSALDYLLPLSDAIVIGGGLGPTHDDITLEALSRYFKIPLAYDHDWISQVEAYFKSRGRIMSESNKKQALLLESAVRIDNDCGTAAGQHLTLTHQNKVVDIFVVPGVPHETKSMFLRYILPYIAKKSIQPSEKILKRTFLTTGIGESALAERCDPFVQKVKANPRFSLAFLPSSTRVALRLQMKSMSQEDEKQFEQMAADLRTYLGDDFYGCEPEGFEELIIRTLQARHETLACAESCTGGYLGHILTLIEGSSDVFMGSVVSYQTSIKEQELGISNTTIQNQGVVSEIVAKEMAEAIRKKWKSTYGISITGYLGNHSGDTFATAGTVWIALATENKTLTRKFQFEADRTRGKERAARAALDLLRRNIGA